jgi:5'/3'-nucleotidase
MKVLITNDDGVRSPGLHALARAVADAGYEVVVVAPSNDLSGAGASIGKIHADWHIDAQPLELPGCPGIEAYAIEGPPGLCVLASRLGAFGKAPDMVVSGINPGCNTGRAVLHSGTVGAALTAANFGVRGLAVSIDVPGTPEERSDPLWATAATVGVAATNWLVDAADGTVLNVNVPDLAVGELRGARWATLAEIGTVRSAVVEAPAERGRLQMELRPSGAELPPDSDTALVRDGYVAVTALTGIQAAPPIDVEPIVGPALSGNGAAGDADDDDDGHDADPPAAPTETARSG